MESNIPSFDAILRWGLKGGFSIVDQALFSGANFIANILLARWLSLETFGSYSIAFSILMFFYQVYFAFVLDPMSALGPANYAVYLKNYLVHQIKLHFIILMPVSVLGFVLYGFIRVQTQWSNMVLLNLAIMLSVISFLLLPWMFRRIVYVLQRPGIAALTSGIYATILLGLFIFLRENSTFTTLSAIFAMALASLLATSFLFHLLRRDREIHSIPLRKILTEHWHYGKWLIASSFFVIAAGQAQVFIAGSVLGIESAGIVRALQNFAQPMILVVTAFGNLAIPTLAADFGRADVEKFRTKVSAITVGSVSIASLYLLLLYTLRKPIELLFYGGQYSAYSDLIPVWGIIPLLLAINVAPASALQAIQKPYALLIVSVFWTIATVGSGFLFSSLWGIWGITISAVLGYLVAVTVFEVLYRIWVVREIAPIRPQP